MKKHIAFLFILLALATATSITGCGPKDNTTPSTCSNGIKDGDETGVDCGGSCTACTVAQTRIKTIISTSPINRSYDSLVYDNSGRQILTLGDTRRYEYVYKTDSVIKTYEEFNSNIWGSISYVVNSSGLAVAAVEHINNGTVTYYQYTYDAQGYLVKEVRASAGGSIRDTIIHNWLNGNLVSRIISYANDISSSYDSDVDNYTYFTDKANSISDENKGILFLGKSSKNLLKSINPGTPGEINIFYTYDANGRVTIEDTYMLYSYY